MNKKKIITIVTAIAIAASAFTAVTPVQSAVSIPKNPSSCEEIKKPFYEYTRSTKLPSLNTMKAAIADAKKAYQNAVNAIQQSKLTKTAKAVKLAQIQSCGKYITRAEGYIEGYQLATQKGADLNNLYAKFEKAVENKDVEAVLTQYTALQGDIQEAKESVKDVVWGAKTEALLFEKFITPVEMKVAKGVETAIEKATATMKKPYDKYTKSTTKLAALNTVKMYIADAKEAQKDITASIEKSALTETEKAERLAQIQSYEKYITRSEGYIEGYQLAKYKGVNLNNLYAELEKAVEDKDIEAALTKYTALQEAIKEAEEDIKATVYGVKVENLLIDKSIEPTKEQLVELQQAYALLESAKTKQAAQKR